MVFTIELAGVLALVAMLPLALAEIGMAIAGLILLVYAWRRLCFIGEDEYVKVKHLTYTEVMKGPKVVLLPILIKQAKKKKAVSIGELEYCIVKDTLTGEKRVEKGPQLFFKGPYDWMESLNPTTAVSLKSTEYIRFLDQQTGKIRVVIGEQGMVLPGAYEVALDGGKRQAIDLKSYEYVKIADRRTGQIRVERGEKLVFLGPDEFELEGGKKQAIDLKVYEWVKLEDKTTGKTRVERGEQLVFPGATENVVHNTKQRAIEVDDQTAVLVRNKQTGQQGLMTEKKLYIPASNEEILEVRSLIKLADYEACIVRDKDGRDSFYFGKNAEQRSFFLPAHAELVQLVWSRGRRRERRDLIITKIDLRPMYMSFEFNCRTADNVELILEGSFFWEVKDLEAMVKFTRDTSGDICNHARSRFIELVSKVKLQEFMENFNSIAERVHKTDDTFYTQRGVLIHSLEVTGYKCAEQSTAVVLQQIIQETTNRMNRLQKQESENEVHMFQIQGDIEEEKARSELLDIQTANNNARAQMEGLGEAERAKKFLEGLKDMVPELQDRLAMWNTLRKGDALGTLAQGNAKLYFTPNDCNLSIENHEHHDDSYVK